MKRIRQTFDELIASMIPIESSWLDEHAEQVIAKLRAIPQKDRIEASDINVLLSGDFQVGLTVIRLFMDMSKDEFIPALREKLSSDCGHGVKRFQKDRPSYVAALEEMGLFDRMNTILHQPLHWSDVLVERLKGGRGSAIKGQQRGRGMEDFVEEVLKTVFNEGQISARCRFTGATGISTEKTDFAIPDADDPQVLIEVKAYGATGSKQTDVLGDVSRIVEEKRDDTYFFLVTDGITWRERSNDLRKLVALQNLGKIRKIYTKSMAEELRSDLNEIKKASGL